jgi:hypothetical protein
MKQLAKTAIKQAKGKIYKWSIERSGLHVTALKPGRKPRIRTSSFLQGHSYACRFQPSAYVL